MTRDILEGVILFMLVTSWMACVIIGLLIFAWFSIEQNNPIIGAVACVCFYLIATSAFVSLYQRWSGL